MMENLKQINYVIMDPTKNITILVTDPVPAIKRAELSQILMAVNPSCEQVGFLSNMKANASTPQGSDNCPAPAVTADVNASYDIRLDMMGGEFCGNATKAAAAYFASTKNLNPGDKLQVAVSSSGVDKPLSVDIICGKDNWGLTYTCTLQMPAPKKIEIIDGFPVVHLPGIAHMIIPADQASLEDCEKVIRGYQKLLNVPAFGMLLWDEEKSYMSPLVYVSDTDTAVRERGCATGSTAVGIWRNYNKKAAQTDVHQPGGTISVDCSLCEYSHAAGGAGEPKVFAPGTCGPDITSVVLLVSAKETLRTSIL